MDFSFFRESYIEWIDFQITPNPQNAAYPLWENLPSNAFLFVRMYELIASLMGLGLDLSVRGAEVFFDMAGIGECLNALTFVFLFILNIAPSNVNYFLATLASTLF